MFARSDPNGQGDIYVMDADGSDLAPLTTSEFGSDGSPDWSPDGPIAFVSNRDGNTEIYVMHADGSGQTRLTDTPTVWEQDPVWSPDGSRIAFTSGPDASGSNDQEISVMDADGSDRTRLTDNAARDAYPAWSPDGTRIAFASNRDGQDEDDIYVMNADGTGQTNLTDSQAYDSRPSWQEDGSAPQVAVAAPVDGSHVDMGAVVAADYACTDGESGIATCEGPVADGVAFDTASPGAHQFTVVAEDRAGNRMFERATYVVDRRQPDATIRKGSGPSVGDGVYNTTAAGQTRTASISRGASVVFVVTAQNDGTALDALVVKGQPATSAFRVAYRDGAADVTDAVVAGTYVTPPLPPGATHTLEMRVTARAVASAGSTVSRTVKVISQSDPTRRDTVKAVVTRR